MSRTLGTTACSPAYDGGYTPHAQEDCHKADEPILATQDRIIHLFTIASNYHHKTALFSHNLMLSNSHKERAIIGSHLNKSGQVDLDQNNIAHCFFVQCQLHDELVCQ